MFLSSLDDKGAKILFNFEWKEPLSMQMINFFAPFEPTSTNLDFSPAIVL